MEPRSSRIRNLALGDDARVGHVWRKSIDCQSSYHIALPRKIYEDSEKQLLSIESKVRGLWSPKIDRPIEIPRVSSGFFYKFHSRAFAKSYFYKNTFKALVACNILRHHLRHFDSFVDLGAGSGAFCVASHEAIGCKNFELVDRSANQLKLAEVVMSRVCSDRKFELTEVDIRDYLTENRSCLSSYAMGESLSEGVNFIEKICLSSTFTIIESPTFVRLAYPILEECGLHVTGGHVEFQCGPRIEHLVEGGRGHFAYLHSSKQR